MVTFGSPPCVSSADGRQCSTWISNKLHERPMRAMTKSICENREVCVCDGAYSHSVRYLCDAAHLEEPLMHDGVVDFNPVLVVLVRHMVPTGITRPCAVSGLGVLEI